VADEHDVFERELAADREHVVHVAVEPFVLRAIVGASVRAAVADIVEEHDSVVVLEGGRDEAPHVLVAAEAVREEHRLRAAAGDLHVVAL